MLINQHQSALTPYCKHIKPRPALEDSNKYNNADDTKRDDGQFLGEFIHAKLEWCALLFNLSMALVFVH